MNPAWVTILFVLFLIEKKWKHDVRSPNVAGVWSDGGPRCHPCPPPVTHGQIELIPVGPLALKVRSFGTFVMADNGSLVEGSLDRHSTAESFALALRSEHSVSPVSDLRSDFYDCRTKSSFSEFRVESTRVMRAELWVEGSVIVRARLAAF